VGSLVVGVDEAGRGALAGPVVAAAVQLLNPDSPPLLKDSKVLTAAQRDTVFAWICTEENAKIGIGMIDHHKIDEVNILQATLMAMSMAICQLAPDPNDDIIVDGNRVPLLPDLKVKSMVKGDQKVKEISAASIVAKVLRDRLMISLSEKYPAYGFDIHKGYGTPAHYEVIFSKGLCPIHRKSFSYVKQERLF
jgi:ribonuclease HII